MSNSFLSINSNTWSLRAQRRLTAACDGVSSSFEKLSSGLRINRPSDDAASLAVVASLKADTRIYSQGVRNLNDGVSALNIANDTLTILSSIVIRMQELAQQSASGSLGWKQRLSLDAEAQELSEEYYRISRSVDFNGIRMFDGSLQELSLQAGYGEAGSISSSLGGALGTGTFGASLSYEAGSGWAYDVSVADINGDGIQDIVTAGAVDGWTQGYASIRLGNGDGTFQTSYSYETENTSCRAVSLSDVNQDGILDLVTAGETDGLGYATIRIGNGNGTFNGSVCYQMASDRLYAVSVSDINLDGIPDLVTAGYGENEYGASIRLGNGDGTFGSVKSFETETVSTYSLSVTDINRDGILDLVTAGDGDSRGYATVLIGNGDGTFKYRVSYETETGLSYALSLGDINGDGAIDLVTAGTALGHTCGFATVRLGVGDGTFGAAVSYETESRNSHDISLMDINGDGALDLVTAGDTLAAGYATIRSGSGDGTFGSALSYVAEESTSFAVSMSDVNGDGVQDLVTAGDLAGSGFSTIRLSINRDGISPILPFSLKTQADARQAISLFKTGLDRLSAQIGKIGAFQSRVDSAMSALKSTVLQYQGAGSRIEDIDVAEESANLIQKQILQQTASYVLAQASQAPSVALKLLRQAITLSDASD